MKTTTKPLIDINRLNYLIKKGQASYTDGREEFTYELLCDLMKRLKVRILTAEDPPCVQKKYYPVREFQTMHTWQIKVVSTYEWLEDEIPDDEEEPMEKGDHTYFDSPCKHDTLRHWRILAKRRQNPHEKWSIFLKRNINPKLP